MRILDSFVLQPTVFVAVTDTEIVRSGPASQRQKLICRQRKISHYVGLPHDEDLIARQFSYCHIKSIVQMAVKMRFGFREKSI
jgi:hypothetical protein